MLRSGAMARRWVRSLHRPRSSLDLKDTAALETKGLAGPHADPPGEAPRAGGRSAGTRTRPWTPSPYSACGKTQRGSRGGQPEPEASRRPFLGTARPGPGNWPRYTEEITGNSGSVQSGESPRRQLRKGHRLRESRRRAREVARRQVGRRVPRRTGPTGLRRALFPLHPKGAGAPRAAPSSAPNRRRSESSLGLSLCLPKDPYSLEPVSGARGSLAPPKALPGSHRV